MLGIAVSKHSVQNILQGSLVAHPVARHVVKQIVADVARGHVDLVERLFRLINAEVLLCHRPRALYFLDGGRIVLDGVRRHQFQGVRVNPPFAALGLRFPRMDVFLSARRFFFVRLIDNGDFFPGVQYRHLGRAAEPPHVKRPLRGGCELVERFYLVRPYRCHALAVAYLRRCAHRHGHGQYVPALQGGIAAERVDGVRKLYNAFTVRRLLERTFRGRQRADKTHRRIIVRIVVGTKYVNIAHYTHLHLGVMVADVIPPVIVKKEVPVGIVSHSPVTRVPSSFKGSLGSPGVPV